MPKTDFTLVPFLAGDQYKDALFSPDGRYISYIRSASGESDLFVLDISSKVPKQVTAKLPLSTGTAYGGKIYCWLSDSSGLCVSSNGELFIVKLNDEPPLKLEGIPQGKAFAPHCVNDMIVFCLEKEDHMEVGFFNISDKKWAELITYEAEFQYDPFIHPNSKRVLLHAWNTPFMSWDRSRIVEFILDSGEFKELEVGENISTGQPMYSPDGNRISFISDRSGYWNLWILDVDGVKPRHLVNEPFDCKYSTWVTGGKDYTWSSDSKFIYYIRYREAANSLVRVNVETGKTEELLTPKGSFSKISVVKNRLLLHFTSYNTPQTIQIIDLNSLEVEYELRSGIYRGEGVIPKHISYSTFDEERAYGLLYKPDKTLPGNPCIFVIHGGPTGMRRNEFEPLVQYLASLGWTLALVNHRGSVGYGREYRQKLTHSWGIYDVKDTIWLKKQLVDEGIISSDKCAIMGGSAGGYTTLKTLVDYPTEMKAGVNLYGVTDLFALGEETHFLEAKYDQMLVGDLPEHAKEYYERSPIFHAEKIDVPLLVLQGEDDPVVVKSQSDRLVEKLHNHVEYKVYSGEGHGFSKWETLQDMYPRISRFLKKFVLYEIPG